MQGPGEKEVAAEKRPAKHAENSTHAEPPCPGERWFIGQWSRSSGSMVEPARTGTSGQRKSEQTVRSVMMTNWRRQRCRPRGLVAREVVEIVWPLSGIRTRITIDRVLRARGKMMKNKANGPADCLVTEMLQCLSIETVYEVTRVREAIQRRVQMRGKSFDWCFSKSQPG